MPVKVLNISIKDLELWIKMEQHIQELCGCGRMISIARERLSKNPHDELSVETAQYALDEARQIVHEMNEILA